MQKNQKLINISIVIGSGWGIRIFLQSQVLNHLKGRANIKIILSKPLMESIHEEQIRLNSAELIVFKPKPGRYQKAYIKRDMLFNRISSTTTRKYNRRNATRNTGFLNNLKKTLKRLWNILTVRERHYLSILQSEKEYFSIEYAPIENYYKRLFESWKTDMVIVATPHLDDEIPPIICAQNMGIKVGAWVNSWDNLTSKPAYRAGFDAYFLWSRHLTQQLTSYYPEARNKKIFATGAPHFDWYISNSHELNRTEFCVINNLDPNAKIILYAACTPHLYPNEHLLVSKLMSEIKTQSNRFKIQIVVRLHPGDSGVRFEGLKSSSDVIFQLPNKSGALGSYAPEIADNIMLVNTVKHADVVINTASTMTIDASIANTPSINIAFDINGNHATEKMIREYYQYDHFKTVVDLNASRIAYSYSELIKYTNMYLHNRSLDSEGRAKLVDLWCGDVDGQSSKRLADAIIGSFE